MDAGSASFTVLELFKLGGIFMWPLLFFSVATVAIALERTIFLLYHNLKLEDLKTQISLFIMDDNINEAKEYLEAQPKRKAGARILLAIINRAGHTESRIEKAAEAEALDTINTLENGFNFLTALGSLAPLTGFLGTVSGMIAAFKSIAEATEVNAQIVANGIYEALITTVFGLCIAIVATIAHSLFVYVVDRFSVNVEKTCSDLIADLATMKKIQE